MKQRLIIGGMSCSACSLGIEKAVKALNGVISAEVSLISKEMFVEFDENTINLEKIIEIVVKLGYTVKRDGEKDVLSDAKLLKHRLIWSLIILAPLIYLCMGGMLSFPLPSMQINFVLQLVLTVIVVFVNKKFFVNGVKSLINKMPNMDTLITLGAGSAIIFSLVLTVACFLGNAVGHVYYDSAAMVLTLVTLGKYIEEISKNKTGDAIEKLNNLLPKTTTILVDGKEKVVLNSLVKVNDLVLLKAGDYVTIDGQVVEGHAGVDNSAITGESIPREVSVGDNVSSGVIVKEGYLIVKAINVGDKTLFNRIIQTVKKAGQSKAPVQKLADKVAGVFVPIVTSIAVLTFVIWIIASNDVYSAFNFGISVLVISCPCALGLATPVAVVSATGASAKHGILFKNAEALENLSKINLMMLDKTATLTIGEPTVTDYVNFTGESNDVIFPLISALERKSSHPLANCIASYCGESDKNVDNYEYFIGKGIVGEINGVKYYVGNKDILPLGIELPSLDKKFENKTIIYFADEIQLVSVFALADNLKEDAKETIEKLNHLNVKTVMLTGDNQGVAKRIAEEVGISEVEWEVLPDDKYCIVENYKAQGYFTSMVGDGINDSPALKSSHVGIAMGTGTDIAIDSADLVIANGNLLSIVKAINISKKSFRIIKQNLFWAFIYNMLAIPIAGGALSFIGFTLTPIIASALMCCSSLFVVTNALRLSEKTRKNKLKHPKKLKTIEVVIEGMHCKHCESKVFNALSKIKGIDQVNVDLKTKTATLEIDTNVTDSIIEKEINSVGFTVSKILKNDSYSH